MAFDSRWMNAWRDAVNRDPTMPVIGRYFTTDFLLGFGDDKYVVAMREGRIEHITNALGPDTTYTFALQAPKESWEKFIQPIPPPMFNDIWAMAHPLHGSLSMEADVKVLWQHARALAWMLERMREVPASTAVA